MRSVMSSTMISRPITLNFRVTSGRDGDIHNAALAR